MFNIGDKVKLFDKEYYLYDDRFEKDGVYTIKSFYEEDGKIQYYYLFDDETGVMYENELEKVEDNTIPIYDTRKENFILPAIDLSSLPSLSGHIKSDDTFVKQKKFSHERYNEIVEEVIAQIKELSEKKGGEYAGDTDRLANFRRNAANLELNMEDIWAVYAGKHWDAIQQYVKDLRSGKKRERLESISGRADDLIVYAILFKAMVEERGN